MKKYCLQFAIFIFTCTAVSGEIKNGYEKNILQMKRSLSELSAILIETTELSPTQRHKIEYSIEALVNHISGYELTENLLNQFRAIAPALSNEIDTIKDRKGRPVDVYVKFVPTDATEIKACGTTYIAHAENDPDTYNSEYGEFTVSVKIWIVSNALTILSHELGHVKYLVPNLASYIDFHKNHYNSYTDHSNYFGHNSRDQSGKSAFLYERLFKKEYANFMKISGEKIPNPLLLIAKIKKNLNHNRMIL